MCVLPSETLDANCGRQLKLKVALICALTMSRSVELPGKRGSARENSALGQDERARERVGNGGKTGLRERAGKLCSQLQIQREGTERKRVSGCHILLLLPRAAMQFN